MQRIAIHVHSGLHFVAQLSYLAQEWRRERIDFHQQTSSEGTRTERIVTLGVIIGIIKLHCFVCQLKGLSTSLFWSYSKENSEGDDWTLARKHKKTDCDLFERETFLNAYSLLSKRKVPPCGVARTISFFFCRNPWNFMEKLNVSFASFRRIYWWHHDCAQHWPVDTQRVSRMRAFSYQQIDFLSNEHWVVLFMKDGSEKASDCNYKFQYFIE